MDKEKVIDTLNELIETSKDGQQGFNTSNEDIDDPQLKAVFAEGARRCAAAATELQSVVRSLGGDPERHGSVAGAMHRGWVNLKTAVASKDELAVLEEVERGEDYAVKSYRDALKEELPSDIRNIVQRQYEGALENHNRIRGLRDAYRAAHR